MITALQARGREAIGLEREARDGVIAGEIEEFGERPGKWAGVVFWHSLEHLRHPGAAVDQAVRLLAPGGVIAIAVPNLASSQARCFGDHWFTVTCRGILCICPPGRFSVASRLAGCGSSAAATGGADSSCSDGFTGWCEVSPDTPTCTARSGDPKRVAILSPALAAPRLLGRRSP